VGRDEQMRLYEGLINSGVSWVQPEELTEQMSSGLEMDQRMQLTAAEDLSRVMNIGGIQIFLPFSRKEAGNGVVDDAATAREEQSTVTVQEELVQMVKTAQAEMREENERSTERLDDFIQRAENAFNIEAEETAIGEFAAEAEKE
jgi:hypothetical protein